MNIDTSFEFWKTHQHKEANPITTKVDGTPLSYVFDESWDFSGMEKFAVGKTTKVSFKGLKNQFRQPIQSALGVFFEKYQHKNKVAPTRSQTDCWKYGLKYISDVLGNCEWPSLLDDTVYKRFKRKLKTYIRESNLSETTVSNIITSLYKLSEGGMCQRLFDGDEIRGLSQAKSPKQHIGIPIGMYQPLIAQSIAVVEAYHPYRKDIDIAHRQAIDILHKEENRKDASKNYSAIMARANACIKGISHKIPDYKLKLDGTQLGALMSSCAVVVLAFSGMRVGEMLSLSKNSYDEKVTSKNNKISVLKGATSKGNDGQPKAAVWQTHSIVKDALELIYDATQHLRERDIYR